MWRLLDWDRVGGWAQLGCLTWLGTGDEVGWAPRSRRGSLQRLSCSVLSNSSVVGCYLAVSRTESWWASLARPACGSQTGGDSHLKGLCELCFFSWQCAGAICSLPLNAVVLMASGSYLIPLSLDSWVVDLVGLGSVPLGRLAS